MKTRIIYIIMLIFLFNIFQPQFSFSQSEEKNSYRPELYLSFQPGLSIAGSGPHTSIGGGLSLQADVCLALQKMLISAYGSLNTGGGSKYEAIVLGNLRDEYYELGGKVGGIKRYSPNSQIYYSTGLCFLQGKQVYPDPDGGWFSGGDGGKLVAFSPTFGIPLELGWLHHRKAIGYGFSIFMNLNPEEVFGGISFNFAIGRFNYQPKNEE